MQLSVPSEGLLIERTSHDHCSSTYSKGNSSCDACFEVADEQECDGYGVRTCRGTVETAFLKTLYVQFFIHVGTRRIQLAKATANADSAWVTQQARSL